MLNISKIQMKMIFICVSVSIAFDLLVVIHPEIFEVFITFGLNNLFYTQYILTTCQFVNG